MEITLDQFTYTNSHGVSQTLPVLSPFVHDGNGNVYEKLSPSKTYGHLSTEFVDGQFESVRRSKTFGRILATLDLRSKKTLDIGSGSGHYLAHFGPGSLGLTIIQEEVHNGTARGLRMAISNAEDIDHAPLHDERFEAIWANNLFEHLLSPHAFLIKLKAVSEPGALLVLGVPTVPKIASLLGIKKFRGALAANHVNFFTYETLKLSVKFAGWDIVTARSFAVGSAFVDKLVSLISPHIYVVARNNADFRYNDKKMKEIELDPSYQRLIEITKGSQRDRDPGLN